MEPKAIRTIAIEARKARRLSSQKRALPAGLLLALILLALFTLVLSSSAAAVVAEDTEFASAAADQSGPSAVAVVAELAGRRTLNTREYQLSDGSRRLEVYSGLINYKDASGAWQPIDDQVSPSSKDGFARENVKNLLKTYFADDSGHRGTIRVEDDKYSLEISPLGQAERALAAGASQDSKNSLLYDELFDETGARYSVLPGALKEELILASAKAPSTFRFKIDAPGLTPKTQEDGSIDFVDAEGVVHFVLVQPWAKDSALDAAPIDLVHSVSAEGSHYLYEVDIEQKWLDDSARVYPVTVDPTITVYDVAADTYIDSGEPGTIHSNQPFSVMGTGTSRQKDGLVKFNLPDMENTSIHEAHISLWKTYGTSGTSIIHAYRVTSDWSESVTWNTRPTRLDVSDSDTPADGSDDSWYNFDITESVTAWVEADAPNYGVQLVATGTGNPPFLNERRYGPPGGTKLSITYDFIAPPQRFYPLGEFAGHTVNASLGSKALDVDVTDLAINSWGPAAKVSRHYSSKDAATQGFAPGWHFNFDQGLSIDLDNNRIDYFDDQGRTLTFTYDGTTWNPPAGFVASLVGVYNSLSHTYTSWTITRKDQTALTFDGEGTFVSEADQNGNTVTYTFMPLPLTSPTLTIRAANGQAIVVTYNSSLRVTSASYQISPGVVRTVSYTMSPWKATYFTGALAHSAAYTYGTSGGQTRLTAITAQAFTGLAGDATQSFIYTDGDLTEARFPDYASAVPNHNASNTDARVTFAYDGAFSCPATTWGTVRTAGTPTGASGTAITQVFTSSPGNTQEDVTIPSISGPAETWHSTYSYETHYLLSKTSPLGETVSYTYDSRGNVLTKTDELGHTTTYTYPTSDTDPNRDRPLTMTEPQGAVTTYTYDAHGNTTATQRTLNGNPTDNLAKSTFTFADITVSGSPSAIIHGALVQEKRLIAGTTWTTTDYNTDVYYSNGKPKKTVYRGVKLSKNATAADLTVTRTYDSFGNLLTATNTAGTVVETNVYDLAGRLTTSTGPTFTATVGSSSVSTRIVKNYTYDPWGHQTSSYVTSTGDTSGAKANWVTTDYDASGRASQQKKWLWTVAVPAGQVQNTLTLRYDGRGKQVTAAESTVSGQPALNAYDARGNVVAAWKVGVAAYDDSKAQLSTYDAIDRLVTSTAEGNTLPTTYTYTDDNKALRSTQPDGSWTENSYDSYGRASGTTTSRGSTTGVGYDTGNRAISKTGENGLTTAFTYDCLDRLVSAGAPGQTASTTTYNVLHWMLTTTAADAIETGFTYNSAGKVAQEKVAANATTYTIDVAGNVTRIADPQDRRSDMKYDIFARKIRNTQSLAGSPRVNVSDLTITLDSLGRQTATSDSVLGLTHVVTYPLDTASSVPDVITVGSGGSQVQTTILTGADGFEASEQTTIASSPQLPNVLRTINTRDDAHRVTSATIDPGNGSLLAAQYLYDDAGRPQRQWGTTGGGSGYTAAAETTDAYTYDANSGLKITDNLQLASVGSAGPIVSSYSYSTDGRLTEATTNGFTVGYAFNPLGNLVTISPSGYNPTTLTYDAGSRLQTTQVGGATTTYLSWDTANGRRTSQGSTPNSTDPRIRYTYTGTGRLATYVDETRTPQVSAAYTYDARGQRTKSAVTISGQTTTTQFSYEGLLLMGLSAAQTGGTTNDSWKLTYLYDENGRPYAGVYRQPDTSTQPVLFGIITTDRGDVVSLLDSAGNPFAAYRYDAWGNPQGAGNVSTGIWTQSTGLMSQAVANAIAVRQPLRYASYCYDTESGLYYLSARHYDPKTAQFLSKDPIKSNEMSPYQYCGGNPVVNTDPNGARWRRALYTHRVTAANILKYGDEYLKRIARACAEYARDITAGMTDEEKLAWFAYQVREGGPWDFKLLKGAKDANGDFVKFDWIWGSEITLEQFGNILFGYVGAAIGYSAQDLRTMSLAANGFVLDENEIDDETDVTNGTMLWEIWRKNNWPYPYLYYYYRSNYIEVW